MQKIVDKASDFINSHKALTKAEVLEWAEQVGVEPNTSLSKSELLRRIHGVAVEDVLDEQPQEPPQLFEPDAPQVDNVVECDVPVVPEPEPLVVVAPPVEGMRLTVFGLRLATRTGKSFWVCGRELKPGLFEDFVLSELSQLQLSEIKLKLDNGQISVDEVEIEVV